MHNKHKNNGHHILYMAFYSLLLKKCMRLMELERMRICCVEIELGMMD